jgi:23S rRNA pseudouridine2605 synthase
VNGEVKNRLGTKVHDSSVIEINGKVINRHIKNIYLMLNKPPGYLCSRNDRWKRKLIYDLIDIETVKEGIYSVGRLDYLSEGLLLLTNDGEFAYRISHPSRGIMKKYEVSTEKKIPYKSIAAWVNGVYIKGVKYKVSEIEKINSVKAIISLHEGKNREIRILFQSIPLQVRKLRRIAVGPLELGDLPVGKYRYLTETEIQRLIGSVETK